MKASIAMSLILFASQMAAANTRCIVNTSSTTDDTYNQLVMEYDLTASKSFVISRDLKSAESFDFENFAQWSARNGQSVVTFALQDNGDVGIVLSKIDVSKSDNVLPTTAMATGSVKNGQILTLYAIQDHLSVLCMELK